MENLETRISFAMEYFKQGYNCSQAVFMAYSDEYGITPELAAKLATSFGGGMGRLREVCGAVSGMFLVLGMHYPYNDTNDKQAKNTNYEAVQRLAIEFKAQMGSYICADILKIPHLAEIPVSAERNQQFYSTRSCERCVVLASELVGKEILKNRNQNKKQHI
jgi:C_GCAxxG_C_C family probable redox protein